jgi:hypothetical protein
MGESCEVHCSLGVAFGIVVCVVLDTYLSFGYTVKTLSIICVRTSGGKHVGDKKRIAGAYLHALFYFSPFYLHRLG